MRVVPCPRCRREVEWSQDNPFRPFCSERCKTIDFGAWASGQYRIAAPPEAFPEAPPGEGPLSADDAIGD